ALPHLATIQASFGRHDVTGVSAHTGGEATAANQAMGAEAYASGNSVAFASGSPSLHTAAHEAAHVVQQRGGVQLKGGVGQAGDSYERHADAVADLVVQGKSAEGVLGEMAPASGGGGGVQAKAVQFDIKADLHKAVDGWGTDEAAIYARIESASAAEIMAVATDGKLIARVDSDFSGGELHRWRGTLAKRLHQQGQDLLGFAMCSGSDATRRARLRWIGDVVAQRALRDAVIRTSPSGDTVKQAFQSYWEVELTVSAGASSWPVATLQAIHQQLKVMPDQDTRSRVWRELQLTSDPALISRAAYGGGTFSVGSNASTGSAIPMGYGTRLTMPAAVGATVLQVSEGRFAAGEQIELDTNQPSQETVTISSVSGRAYTVTPTTKAHAFNATVGMTGGGGLRDVNWLAATVRHEIAHSVDGIVDTKGFKQTLGGWWSGASFDTWAAAMGNPWGSGTISDADKRAIKAAIEDYVHHAKGTLFALPADHAVRRHWAENVPVIVAAETCLTRGDNFFAAPTALYQASGKVFTCSAWYKVFQYCNTGVLNDRLSDYTLYAPAEFFAETYTVFYEEAGLPGVTDAQLGRHVKNSTWASWIRSNVHERGHAPAGGGKGGGPGAAPAPHGDGAVAATGDGHAGGASHGRKAHNPN
ncbi:MAG TPA: DUF4157 domain-containing protein, partial [Kofleriaceae bacterium]|nr:DUF4157 domain-containing protein [Kofleriaceae bacterium]